MAIVKAHVLISSNKQAIIWPPVILAKKNDDIEIHNFTQDDIAVLYPDKVFDDGSGNLKKSGKVAGKGNKATHKVDNTATAGAHSFKVFCYETDGFATGNSDPQFIIE
jgi:hypothetical protein